MNARGHHQRYVLLCGGLLLAIAFVAWAGEEVGAVIYKSLAVAVATFAGTFLFNRVQRRHEDQRQREEELSGMPSEAMVQVGSAIYLVTLALGVICVAVAVLAPLYLPKVAWVVPVLAGAAGIHVEALT
jgi:uncharacterized membrane protein YkgB